MLVQLEDVYFKYDTTRGVVLHPELKEAANGGRDMLLQNVSLYANPFFLPKKYIEELYILFF